MNRKLWQDFLKSVRREVDFYNKISKANPELFPSVYYSSGIVFQILDCEL